MNRCPVLLACLLLLGVWAVWPLLSGSAGAQVPQARLDQAADFGPAIGAGAVDFTLRTLEGETFILSAAWEKGPVVIEFGSFT